MEVSDQLHGPAILPRGKEPLLLHGIRRVGEVGRIICFFQRKLLHSGHLYVTLTFNVKQMEEQSENDCIHYCTMSSNEQKAM
jgi:hypothetical protein